MRILIAEDEPGPRMILQRTLEKFDHECLVAEDGRRAWEIYQNTPEVDVVISDWMMPGIDGLELCRRIREADNSWYTFFVFLTALEDKKHLLEGMQAGADDYLVKPLDREQLQIRLIAASRSTSLHRQLTEQKKQLLHHLDFNRAITSSLGAGLFALDYEGRATFINPAAERALGWEEKEFIGVDVQNAITSHKADGTNPPGGASSLLEAMRLGNLVRVDDAAFRRKDGSTFPVSYTSSLILEDRQAVGVVVAFRDMTDLWEAEEMKNQFVSTVSHELRTPLTSIRGYLEALIEDEAGPLNEEQREYAEISYRNAKRLEMLVGDLLTLSRLDSGRLQLDTETFDIGEALRQVEEELRPVAENKELRLSVEAEPRLTVTGDRLRIVQVLSNLLINAIKFSSPDRNVWLRAWRSDGEVLVEVVDQGVGIPASELSRLTERFFRASTAGTIQGTGLGLAISKEIVERHGGRLQIESEEEAGATFRVALPAA